MGNDYGYTRFAGAGYYLTPILFVCLSLLLVTSIYLTSTYPSRDLQNAAVILSLILIAGIPSCCLSYRYGSNRFAVTRDELVHTTRQGVRRYPLEAVYVLDASSPRISGALLKAGDDTIKVWCGLQDMPGFITELKEALDAKNLSHHYDRSKLLTLLSRIINAKDEGRWFVPVCGTYGLLLCNTCAASVVGFACGASSWGSADFTKSARSIIFWTGFSLLFWAVITIITGFTCKYCVAKRKIDEGSFAIGPPDTVSEKRIMSLCFILASVTYMIISACVVAWI